MPKRRSSPPKTGHWCIDMKVIKQFILTAEEGYYLTNGETYGTTVILPSAEDVSNWHEITKEAYNSAKDFAQDSWEIAQEEMEKYTKAVEKKEEQKNKKGE